MPFKRYIVDRLVEPDLAVDLPPEPDEDAAEGNLPLRRARYKEACKEKAVEAIVDLMARSGEIRNVRKFLREFKVREKATSSALGNGIAIPHLRSLQPRKLVVAVARSVEGVEFDAPDGEPVHLFFCLTAPPYDDKLYLKFHRWVVSEILAEPWLVDALMDAESAHEMVRILRGLYY